MLLSLLIIQLPTVKCLVWPSPIHPACTGYSLFLLIAESLSKMVETLATSCTSFFLFHGVRFHRPYHREVAGLDVSQSALLIIQHTNLRVRNNRSGNYRNPQKTVGRGA